MKKNRYFNFLFLIIFALSLFISCKNNKEKIVYFEKLENEQELQSAVLFSLKNDSISTVQYNILESFYNNQKARVNYENFQNLLENLNNLSNEEKHLLYFTDNYKFDDKIKSLENLSFDDKAKKLNLESNLEKNYFVSPSKYTKEELFSILYIFYRDQSYILFDDDIGQYLVLNNLK